MSQPATIEMLGIQKRFGDVIALNDVTFKLPPNEVHVLAGENGAGKTTLMNILAGLYQPDHGEIRIGDEFATIASPNDALARGIGMVHQHFELVPSFSALENIVLGAEGGAWLRLSSQRSAIEALMERFGISVDLDATVKNAPVGVQQKIEIIKSLYRGVSVLILDEPTTHLTPQEVDGLFGTLRRLLEGGLTVVLITHKIREILAVADRITVMRRGQIVSSIERTGASEDVLLEMLMGGRAESPAQEQTALDQEKAFGAPLLELTNLCAAGAGHGLVVDHCTLSVRAGEIVGIAGVSGNGQRELADVILGTRPASAGTVRIAGTDMTHRSVRDRLLSGLVLIPEDRLLEGILPRSSLTETFALGPHHGLFRGRILYDEQRVRALTREAIAEYGVVARDELAPTASLSGGNIQKLLVARALIQTQLTDSSALITFNPTRGLDVGTTRFVHSRLRELRERGVAILLISEDLDELMSMSDRIAVLYRGGLVGELNRPDFDAYAIGSLMAGTPIERSA